MAVLAVQKIVRTGLTPAYSAAAAGGDSFPNDGQSFAHLKNTNAANRTATFASKVNPLPVGTQLQDAVVLVPLTVGDKMVGPFPPSAFNDGTNQVLITYDAVTNLTIGIFTLAP